MRTSYGRRSAKNLCDVVTPGSNDQTQLVHDAERTTAASALLKIGWVDATEKLRLLQ